MSHSLSPAGEQSVEIWHSSPIWALQPNAVVAPKATSSSSLAKGGDMSGRIHSINPSKASSFAQDFLKFLLLCPSSDRTPGGPYAPNHGHLYH